MPSDPYVRLQKTESVNADRCVIPEEDVAARAT
jgi:hypothetical protein